MVSNQIFLKKDGFISLLLFSAWNKVLDLRKVAMFVSSEHGSF